MSVTYTEWRRQRGCDRKIGYHCALDANAAVLRLWRQGKNAQTYDCEHCGLIHLTSKEADDAA